MTAKSFTLIIFLVACTTFPLLAQQDSIKPAVSLTAYVETYYCFDFNQPNNNVRPVFMYSHNRHNEINLNLGLIKMAYSAAKVRANIALMAGTYSNANLAAEPGVLRNVFEGNIGVKLSKSNNLWIDAGVLPAHIGFESAIGKDCWTLTRSILADNSPYYESGVKLTYVSPNEKWSVSGLVLNGWQRIQRMPGNSLPAFGHQLTYKPNANITLNSSSFIGSDTPDSTRQMRYFHNFYAIAQPIPQLGLIFGFDAGAQQKSMGENKFNIWYTPVLMLKYALSSKTSICLRGEYYSDKNGVVISSNTANGFKTFGYSINLDWQIGENALWRIEARGFASKDPIFIAKNGASRQNKALTTAVAISF